MHRRAQHGFTLIELMVVVALVGIIATIAFNAFSDSGKDSRRTRGMADIQALNDAMNRLYQTNFSYSVTDTGSTTPRAVTLTDLTTTYRITLNTYYTYAVTVPTTFQSYQITATPTGSQAGDGAMQMDNTGRRCYYPGNDGTPDGTCPHTF